MSEKLYKIFVNKKSINSFLFKQMKDAHLYSSIIPINTNTAILNSEYNLISIDPKKRGWQKSHYIGMLHRSAKWKLDPNGRSTDFLPTNMLSFGCKYMCSYCYVDRRDDATFPKLYDDALSVVDLIDDTMKNISKHRDFFKSVVKKDFEKFRNSNHSNYVTFDMGCDSDCVIDNTLTKNNNYYGHIIDIINKTSDINEAMISFATKCAEIDDFIKYVKRPQMTRIRLSLMLENHRRVLEMNTSKIEDRLLAINKLVKAGFETHINLSPIVVTEKFIAEYEELFNLINERLSDDAKKTTSI